MLLQRLSDLPLIDLLNDDTPWESLHVTYAEPYVERLWIPWLDGRLYLHRIHPCKGEALWHPHPWPSASTVIRGGYVHRFGRGEVDGERICLPGSSWQMTDPTIWHSVAPYAETLTVMVTGPLYANPESFDRPSEPQSPLTDDARLRLLVDFREAIVGE